jgi:CBS domain-containing membrane protein
MARAKPKSERGSDMFVRDLMTRDVTTLEANDELTVADDVMRLGRIRHMPVLDDEDRRVVGIVSQRDLFRGSLVRAFGYGEAAQRRVMKTIPVKEVMSSQVVTIASDAPLAEAARLMVERKIGCLPVVDAGELVGILTESDFVALVARFQG